MAYMNFVEALMSAKRRAQLQGRPLSQQEATGISEGYAHAAKETGIQERGVELQEKGLAQQEEQFARSLAQRKYETQKQVEAAEEARKVETYRTAGMGVGTVAGAVIGSVVPGLGTAVGAGVGAVAGGALGQIFGGGCIIISSCTSPHSYEVEIAQEYRDNHMDETTLTGYYALCLVLVRFIYRWSGVRKLFKKVLVDRLVDYGEWRMGHKPKREFWTSYIVSRSFLSLCRVLGMGVNRILEVAHG